MKHELKKQILAEYKEFLKSRGLPQIEPFTVEVQFLWGFISTVIDRTEESLVGALELKEKPHRLVSAFQEIALGSKRHKLENAKIDSYNQRVQEDIKNIQSWSEGE